MTWYEEEKVLFRQEIIYRKKVSSISQRYYQEVDLRKSRCINDFMEENVTEKKENKDMQIWWPIKFDLDNRNNVIDTVITTRWQSTYFLKFINSSGQIQLSKRVCIRYAWFKLICTLWHCLTVCRLHTDNLIDNSLYVSVLIRRILKHIALFN